MEFSPESPLSLVTVHGREEAECYVCLWSVARPQWPSLILRTSSEVTCVCTMANIVFAGSQEGDVMAWDGRESVSSHQQVVTSKTEVARSPTFTSSEAHESKITAIKPLPSGHSDLEVETFSQLNGLSAFQIVTLEVEGKVVIWTLLDHQKDYEKHLGLAHWGQVRMVASNTIHLHSLTASDPLEQQEHHGHDISMDPLDVSRFYVASDGGTILHGSTQADHRPSPRTFKSEIGKEGHISHYYPVTSILFYRNCFKLYKSGLLSLRRALHAGWLRGRQYQAAQHQHGPPASHHLGRHRGQPAHREGGLVHLQALRLLHTRHG